MNIKYSELINGVWRKELELHEDSRGHFVEMFRGGFVQQINVSFSKAGVLRGLHYHLKQVDYWYVANGNIQVGLLDNREDSPTYQAKEMIDMDNTFGLFIPEGVAHGFLALTDVTLVYLVNQYYDASDEYNIDWKELDWYSDNPILSDRDRGSIKENTERKEKEID